MTVLAGASSNAAAGEYTIASEGPSTQAAWLRGRLYNRVVMTALRAAVFYSTAPSPSVFHPTPAVFHDPSSIPSHFIWATLPSCDTQALFSIWQQCHTKKSNTEVWTTFYQLVFVFWNAGPWSGTWLPYFRWFNESIPQSCYLWSSEAALSLFRSQQSATISPLLCTMFVLATDTSGTGPCPTSSNTLSFLSGQLC